MLQFSIIVPVYNRPLEMEEFLESLVLQTDKAFEVVVMEGRCEYSCKSVCDSATIDLFALDSQVII